MALDLFAAVKVLPCPHCGETINDSMLKCPFCSTSIDTAAAKSSAEAFSVVSEACSDASTVKIAVGSVFALVGLAFYIQLRAHLFVPAILIFTIPAAILVGLVVPATALRWWVKFASLPSKDPEFISARISVKSIGMGSVMVYLCIGLVAFLIYKAS